MKTSLITKLSLIIAVSAVIQSLRLVFPLPPIISIFVIGAMLNACIIYSFKIAFLKGACLLSLFLPVIALLQGAFIAYVLIIPALLTNIAYIYTYKIVLKASMWKRISLPSVIRAMTMYLSSAVVLHFFHFGEQFIWLQFLIAAIQILTGSCGIYLGEKLDTKIGQ
ncbi:hypothetical protein [Pectinatus sottacetonis]|uniref:hypothetical protein n=1 Tax=Pectinatus sottacetonis TaxID=1002795 RepID=UPI0018C467BA|nr:hypothetical protein [Pectinatus sottacetonis]